MNENCDSTLRGEGGVPCGLGKCGEVKSSFGEINAWPVARFLSDAANDEVRLRVFETAATVEVIESVR